MKPKSQVKQSKSTVSANEPITTKEQLMKSNLVKENSNFTPEQIGDLYDAFECFANPSSKLLNMKDFVESLRIYGYEQNKNPILRLMIGISSECETPINFEQFMTLLCSKIGHPSTQRGREAIFKLIDADNKNLITKEDIKTTALGVGLNINEQELNDIYWTYQKTKESKGISLEEFEKYLLARFRIVTPRRITEIKFNP